MALSVRKIPPLPATSVVLASVQPGTLPQTSATTTWPARVQTRGGITTVEWRVLDPRNVPRSGWNTLTDARLTSEAGAPLAVPFVATGDMVEVRAPGDDAIVARSTRVRLLPPDPQEPAVPAGWVVSLYDAFNGSRLGGDWRVVSSGPAFDPALIKVPGQGVVLQAVRGADGAYRTCGMQVGNSVVGGPSWRDLQVSVRFRVDRGVGVGLRVSLVPWSAKASLPKLDLIQTPGRDKQALRVVNYWTGNAAGSAVDYPADLTGWHVVTARRTSGRWNLWLDGAEQVVPTAWAANAYTDPLTLSVATVASGTDATTPSLFSAQIKYVRVSAPG